jgi:hypothetical protein
MKKLLALTMMVGLVLLGIGVAPRTAAACSGDDCGCYIPQEADCWASCPPVGDPDHQHCIINCSREALNCAIQCCG